MATPTCRWVHATLLVAATGLLPARASALEVAVEGGPHLVLWSMTAQLSPQEHSGFAYGIGGRLGAVLGDWLRLRLGYQPGHFTTEDASEIDRAIFSLDVEAFFRPTARASVGLGVTIGADHVSILETLETHDDHSRRVTAIDAWGVAVVPYLFGGYALTRKMRLELESGVAVSYIDGRVQTAFICILGFMFTFEFDSPEAEQ